MHISARWEYLTIAGIAADQVDATRDAYGLVGYEETDRTEGDNGFDLTVRKQLGVSQQLTID